MNSRRQSLIASPHWFLLRLKTLSALITICLLCPISGSAQDDISPLLKRIPDAANTIAIIRVAEILKSPKSVREHWAEKQSEKLLFGSGLVPQWVDTLIVGSQVRIGTYTKEWSVAVLAVPPQFSLEGLAAREIARIEEVGGHRAVRGRRDAYFVDLGDRVLGVMSPADRQDLARWVRRSGTGSGVPEYLQEAAATPAQILLAIDLQDTFDSVRAHAFLNSQPILKTSEIPVADVIDLLKTLRGVRVSAIVNDATEARISLDFGKPVKLPPEVLKALTLAMINDHGLYIPELDRATTTISGRTFALNMEDMSDESLRAVLSLIVTATPEHATVSNTIVQPAPPKTPSTATAVVTPSVANTPPAVVVDGDATSRYFNAVNKIVDDLDKSLLHIHNYLLTATYHENYASRIEHLPVAGVSPDMVEYGSRVTSRLRALAASLRGIMLTVNLEEGTIVYNTAVDSGFEGIGVFGYAYHPPTYSVISNLADVRSQQATTILQGEAQRASVWTLLREDRNNMIRKSTGAAPAVPVAPTPNPPVTKVPAKAP
ncbi:MAG: hypothetical protein JWM11_4470 [Planctomycetaceae bacterium]|nr:hypothetical protein [Planctomycetaceae bacterium]